MSAKFWEYLMSVNRSLEICAICLEEIQYLNIGKQGPIHYCEKCHAVDGATVEMSREEYEAQHE